MEDRIFQALVYLLAIVAASFGLAAFIRLTQWWLSLL
jgi:hypothetical protein